MQDDVHGRARRGIRLLLLRQTLLLLFGFAASVIVSRMLTPAEFGLFGITVFVVNVLTLITDCGMKPALIRLPGPLTERHLATSLALRLLLATVVLLLLWAGAPLLAALYPGAPPALAWLVRAFAVDLYLRAARAQSEIRLERELRYDQLALIDVGGNLVLHTVTIALLFLGWGVRSLVLALLASSVLRTLLIYRAAPWRLRLELDRATVRELARVALPLQAGQLVGQAQGWVTPTVVGMLAGPAGVGLLHWASGNGRKPLEVVEGAVRVSLSHFARLQHDQREVERTLARYVFAFLLIAGLWLAVLAVAGDDLVSFVYGERWLPAVPALVLYAAFAAVTAARWVSATALIALGRVRLTAQVAVVTSVLSIAVSVILAMSIGPIGVPIGQLLGVLVALPWLLARGFGRQGPSRVLRPSLPVAGAVAAAVAVGAIALQIPLAPGARVLLAAGLMTGAYAAVAWWTGPSWLRVAVREELAR
jgi:PST family polysaccharide transporter